VAYKKGETYLDVYRFHCKGNVPAKPLKVAGGAQGLNVTGLMARTSEANHFSVTVE
jgi:hypothetical protein